MNPICQDQIFDSFDVFESLPDEIALAIFNKLQDAKSLCLSMAVCKRFRCIVPQVSDIFLPIPERSSGVKGFDQEIHKGFFKNLVVKALIKPLRLISQMIKFKSKNEQNCESDFHSFYVPNDVLKPFDEIRKLHLKLPCHGGHRLGTKTGKSSKGSSTVLKWKAEFGSELHSCVILGAKSLTEKLEKEEDFPELRIISDEELKLRIVWTISCLIAASARHYLIQEPLKNQKMIDNVVVSDESEQGRLCMNKEQIEELRGSKTKGDDSVLLDYRTKVPALRMKMWYLEKLELPNSGKVMEGATLVVIRPAGSSVGEVKGQSDADLVAGAFGAERDRKIIKEAVKKLMVAKKCYTLEMNSF